MPGKILFPVTETQCHCYYDIIAEMVEDVNTIFYHLLA